MFWNPIWIYKQPCTNVSYNETMRNAYVWPMSVQGQGQSLRLNIVWLYYESVLYLLNPWWDLQITFLKSLLWWDDVQCLCLTKVCSRSRKKINPLSHVAQGVFITFCYSSSLQFHLPLQKNWFHPVTYGGRHDCFHFWKHPSSFIKDFQFNNGAWFTGSWESVCFFQSHYIQR